MTVLEAQLASLELQDAAAHSTSSWLQEEAHERKVDDLVRKIIEPHAQEEVDAEMEDAELLYPERDCPASPESQPGSYPETLFRHWGELLDAWLDPTVDHGPLGTLVEEYLQVADEALPALLQFAACSPDSLQNEAARENPDLAARRAYAVLSLGYTETQQMSVLAFLCLGRLEESVDILLSGVASNRNELTSMHSARFMQHLLSLDSDRVGLVALQLHGPALLLRALPKPGVADLILHLLGFQDGALWANTHVTRTPDRTSLWACSHVLPNRLVEYLRATAWVSLLMLPLHPLVLSLRTRTPGPATPEDARGTDVADHAPDVSRCSSLSPRASCSSHNLTSPNTPPQTSPPPFASSPTLGQEAEYRDTGIDPEHMPQIFSSPDKAAVRDLTQGGAFTPDELPAWDASSVDEPREAVEQRGWVEDEDVKLDDWAAGLSTAQRGAVENFIEHEADPTVGDVASGPKMQGPEARPGPDESEGQELTTLLADMLLENIYAKCGPATRARSDASTAVSPGPAPAPPACETGPAEDIAEIEAMLQDGIFLETKDPSLGWPGGMAVVHHFAHAADFLLRLLDLANKGMRGVSSAATTDDDRRACAAQAEVLHFLFLEPLSHRGLCVVEMVAEAVVTGHPLFASDALRLLEGVILSACSGALVGLKSPMADVCASLLRPLSSTLTKATEKPVGTYGVRGVKTILHMVKLDAALHVGLVELEVWLAILTRMRSAPDMYFAPALELLVLAVSHGSPRLHAAVVPRVVLQIDLCEETRRDQPGATNRDLGWYAPLLDALRDAQPGALRELLAGLPSWRSVLAKLHARVDANHGKPIGILPAEETKRLHSATRAQKMAEKEAEAAAARSKLTGATPPGVDGDSPALAAVHADGRPVSPLASLVEQAIAAQAEAQPDCSG